MAENNLKRALDYVFQQELEQYPDDRELAEKYTFSHHFEQEMKELIKYVKDKYFMFFGRVLNRNMIVIPLALAVGGLLLFLYYIGVIPRYSARFVFSVFELILIAIFGTSYRKASRKFTGNYRTAFSDGEDIIENQDVLEFPLPQAPKGYEKTKEYRTITEHSAEYTDNMGRIIYYERVAITNGFLKKIESGNAAINKLTIKDVEAISFTNGFEANLVWADKLYRYHLHGQCSEETLIEMAENMA